MVLIFGMAQSWWTVIGLILDLIGFVLLAIQLGVDFKVQVLEAFKRDVIALTEPARAEYIGMEVPTAQLRDSFEFEPELFQHNRHRWLATWKLFQKQFRCWKHQSGHGRIRFEKDEDFSGEVFRMMVDAFLFAENRQRELLEPRRKIKLAIWLVSVGFALQIVGAVPLCGISICPG